MRIFVSVLLALTFLATPALAAVAAPSSPADPIEVKKKEDPPPPPPPPSCAAGEEEFGTYFWTFGGAEGCTSECSSFCQDGGGYLLEAKYYSRGLDCYCTCCR